jgi:hypothetical protein
MATIGNTESDQIAQIQAVATLAASIIGNMGRPVSLEEVLKIKNDVYFSLFPSPGHGSYTNWQKTHDAKKVYE